jgi:hypothetical protein
MSKSEKYTKSTALRARQAKVLIALLENKTVADAARASGIGYSTINRWLSDDREFIQDLRRARQELAEQAFGRIAALSSEAVTTLERNLAGSGGVQVRCALGIFALLQKRDASRRYEKLELEVEHLGELIDRQTGEQ